LRIRSSEWTRNRSREDNDDWGPEDVGTPGESQGEGVIPGGQRGSSKGDRHKRPVGKAGVGRAGDRPSLESGGPGSFGGGQRQGQDARSGRRSQGTCLLVRGHGEVKGIAALRGGEDVWGRLGGCWGAPHPRAAGEAAVGLRTGSPGTR
jgi:hypothetical protein